MQVIGAQEHLFCSNSYSTPSETETKSLCERLLLLALVGVAGGAQAPPN